MRERRPPRPGSVLAGGYSNVSVLLEGWRGRYVLRLRQGPPPPGVCPRRELALQRRAAAAGLAPPVLYSDLRRGWLLTPFLTPATPGTMPPRAARRVCGDPTARAIELLRAIHRLPRPFAAAPGSDGATPLHSPRCLDRWRARLGPNDPLARLDRQEKDVLAEAARRISGRRIPAVICHNDLLRANRLFDGTRLVAIDWEYACLGDPLFDLATLVSEEPRESRDELLRTYLGRPPSRAEAERFLDQQRMQTAISACWFAAHPGLATAAALRCARSELRRLLAVGGRP